MNNPDSVALFDLSKHICLSSVPTVEVNVVSSEKGAEDLSVTSRSVGKGPNKNIPHYRPMLDNKSNGGRLRWSNNVSRVSDFIETCKYTLRKSIS